jgi:rhomboid protease GluP
MATIQPEEVQSNPTDLAGPASATPPTTPATPLAPARPKPTLKDWFRCATIVLIALNVLVFVVMVFQGVSLFSPTADSVLRWGADYGPLTLHGQWWRMVVSTFLHFGLIHLFFNMFVLFNIGLFMEDLAGRVGFVVLYLVCGLGGSAASLAWQPSIVSAGASGAIFGLYGALLGFLLRHRGSIPAESLASLRKGAFTFIGYNLLYGLRPGVDMAAHVGGLATGFVLGLFLIERPATFSATSISGGAGVSDGSADRPGEGMAASSDEIRPASNWRVPTAVALGLALIVVPMIALPKPDDYLAEYKQLAAMEEKDIALVTASLKQWQAGQINSQQYADILEKQVLPPWRAEREALEKLHVSRDQAARKRLLVEYLTDREESWQLSVEGLRANDSGKLGQAAQKNAAAEKVAARLRGR